MATLRQKIGCWLYDWPRLLRCLWNPRPRPGAWAGFRNRRERLVAEPGGKGVACAWTDARDLHLCDVYPLAGRWLLDHALRDWPLALQVAPQHVAPDGICANGERQGQTSGLHPQVSFLIGHRGQERLPLLLTTLQSLAGQTGVTFECIVVEQDVVPSLRGQLPNWVRYVHTPLIDPCMPFSRAWALNVAAAHARAERLVFHDNDLVVPERYGAELLDIFRRGYEAINLKRFVFYLARESADLAEILAGRSCAELERVVENLEGGASVALNRMAFEAIGGYDESFIGWGGEDVEFWDRCLTRRIWRYAFLPLVHLWHSPQPGKRAVQGLGPWTAKLTEQRRAIEPARRIAELAGKPRGQVSGSGRMAEAMARISKEK